MGISGVHNVPTVAHELGHTFGLSHDFRNDIKLIPTSYIADDVMLTSFCTAEWLDVHPYFNTNQNTFNQNTNIQSPSLSLTASPYEIRLQFEVTDPDGLHQAQLLTEFEFGNWKESQFPYNTDTGLIACKKLNGESATVEFVTTLLAKGSGNFVVLKIVDVHGNFTSRSFPIDITALLPPSEAVSVPDSNLAAAVRSLLGLTSADPITQLDMLKLWSFSPIPRKNITDFTGLEHATNLRVLDFWNHPIRNLHPLILNIAGLTNLRELRLTYTQIEDVTPLAELTNLKALRELRLRGNKISDVNPLAALTSLHKLWLDSNQVSDITALTELTNLRELRLSNNRVSDITPLKGLTNLNRLWLSNNLISDVAPLAELTNLQELYLEGNPIKDREPIFELLKKNPDIKIYLKPGGEPLPVTLSHFRAEHTDAGVVLKWTTESEVDNAGFYIHRSETKNGEFKVVNPTMIQGAGTTSERNTYTWKDTTAKPNVAYYYRIEDISHAGDRKQLATVRMRGLVSASGKLTTRWADLKTQN